MNQRSKRLLSILLSLVLILGLVPGMSLTAYAAPTEELLTTITATGKEQASYSTANVATVSFSNLPDNSSVYSAIWGWWGYGWSATVNAAEGYTITKCVFYDDKDRTATDSEAPFVVETTEEDKTPQVNGTPILAYTSKGITKIEVYGYATPAHTHSFTYSASGATITATCGEGCDITEGLTLTISAPTGDLTADGSKTFLATLSTGYNTTVFPGTYEITYTKDGEAFTGTPTEAGEYTASVTVGTATASVSYTVTAPTVAVTFVTLTKGGAAISAPIALTVGGDTATLTATVAPAEATNKTVVWTTTDANVATVENGVVTAVAAGSATITATATNGTEDTSDDVSASCTVNVSDPAPADPNRHTFDDAATMIANKTTPENNDPATKDTDKLFLGWYKDEACTQPITSASDIPEGGAYAKFIPEKALGLSVQFRDPAKSGQEGKLDLRLLATVPDPSLYSEIGFKVEAYRNGTWRQITDTHYSDNIYTNAVTQTVNGKTTYFTVADMLKNGVGDPNWSKFITSLNLLNMPNSYLEGNGTQFKVTQYIITKDSTTATIGVKNFTIFYENGVPTAR